jgi:hypothetical protein
MHRDPGPGWADSVLSPLRRERADCDVVAEVMARIRVLPGALTQGRRRYRPGLAWASWLASGLAALEVLAAALWALATRGELDLRPVWGLVAPLGRVALLLGEILVGVVTRTVAAGAALLHGFWILLEIAGPLLRGAGFAAAAGGVLSIAISLYVFANARRAAPAAGFRADPFHGGTR